MLIKKIELIRRSFKNIIQPWNRILTDCQNEISSLDPYPYYLTAYRDAEFHYWEHIPKWIYKDWRRGAVKKCLDIGCAYGTLSLFCKKVFDCEVYLTDFIDTWISQTFLEKYGFWFSINDIELDPFPWEATFDFIIFTEVLEHFNFHPLPTLIKISGSSGK